MREFDLNIEKILESWEVYHAIREIIANALDEQVITQTKNIEIVKNDDGWHIIDFGRGLNYHHLTQNESEEKINNDKLIGRFGVGLKDALATLYRHEIKVKITSKHGIITLKQSSKIGFDDIITLHAEIAEPTNPDMIGTDFLIYGCDDSDIEKAKKLFLAFSDTEVLETTSFGQVIKTSDSIPSIYINGVKVAEESNFLFSYNITALTKQLKKALNRERTNVGRTAYTDRVKAILTACENEAVIQCLVDDLQEMGSGTRHDELSWNDVALYASQKMSEINDNITFVTTEELENTPSIIDNMKSHGLKPVVVTTALAGKMDDFNRGADNGKHFKTTTQFLSEEREKLSFNFVDVSDLTEDEKEVYSKTETILSLIGGKPYEVNEICISETIYSNEIFSETVGLWEPSLGRITVKRKQLRSLHSYAGTLLHECAHAISGADDVSRKFEQKLTSIIGNLAEKSASSTKLTYNIDFPDFDFSELLHSEEFEAAGIETLDDLMKPVATDSISKVLAEAIRSCNLSIDACKELIVALKKYNIYVYIDKNVQPNISRITAAVRNSFSNSENETEWDFEHRQVINFAIATFMPAMIEMLTPENLPIKDNYELFPYNLVSDILGNNIKKISPSSQLTKILTDKVSSYFNVLSKREEIILRAYYQYNITGQNIETLIKEESDKDNIDVLAWGVKGAFERYRKMALKKLRTQKLLKDLKAFL